MSNHTSHLTRRRILQVTAAGAATALAGCSDAEIDGLTTSSNNGGEQTTEGPQLPENSVPDYQKWIGKDDLPDRATTTPSFVYADLAEIASLQDVLSDDSGLSNIEFTPSEEQYVYAPLEMGDGVIEIINNKLGVYSPVVEQAMSNTSLFPDSDVNAPNQETDDVLLVGNTVVLRGDYDPEALYELVDGFGSGDEIRGFRFHLGYEEDNLGTGFVVSENALIFLLPSAVSDGSAEQQRTNAAEQLMYRVDVATDWAEHAVSSTPSFKNALQMIGDSPFAFGSNSFEMQHLDQELDSNAVDAVGDPALSMVMGTNIESDTIETASSFEYLNRGSIPSQDSFTRLVNGGDERIAVIDGAVVKLYGRWDY